MAKKLKDTDFLSISSRIRAMENRLLTRERMERMLDARTGEEAAKVLTECGYAELNQLTPSALDTMLSQAREETYRELGEAVDNAGLVDVFRIKYDYHNAKVLVKAQAMSQDPTRPLAEGGRYRPDTLREAYEKEDLESCSKAFREAVLQARDTLAATSDPQSADMLLDQAYYAELLDIAQKTGSQFLLGYVRLSIDAANLRSAVRSARMERGADFLAKVLIPGGKVPGFRITGAKEGELTGLFTGLLAEAAVLGVERSAPGSGRLTAFERACDNALMAYMAQAKRVPFGEQPVVGYLFAKESEFTAIRIILSGRMDQLGADVIRERLREAYV